MKIKIMGKFIFAAFAFMFLAAPFLGSAASYPYYPNRPIYSCGNGVCENGEGWVCTVKLYSNSRGPCWIVCPQDCGYQNYWGYYNPYPYYKR